MKVHIVSLQRSGSKSLYNAVHKAMVADRLNPLTFDNGDRLEEFLHCWSEYGYKFGLSAQKPFDQNSEIVFRTRDDFRAYKGTNFKPKFADGKLTWEPAKHLYERLFTAIRERLLILNRAQDFVVKTQVASLLEDVGFLLQQEEVEEYLFRDQLFTHTVFLIPDNVTKWMCSNFLCDYSGVFVQCKSQEEAAAQFKMTPVVIPKDYIVNLSNRYAHHMRLANTYRGFDLFTADLRDGCVTGDLADYLELQTPLSIKDEQEFSAFDYSTMIANYDEVCDAAAKL
jgi:hypothetical protein